MLTVAQDQLLAFLVSLARWVDYDFDAADWDAIRTGLFQRVDDPDEDTELRFEYRFTGAGGEAAFELVWRPFPDEPDWVGIDLRAPDEIVRKAEGAADLLEEQEQLAAIEANSSPPYFEPLPHHARK